MLPLHYACYWNAPLWAIQFFVRIWSEGMKEVVPIFDESTGVCKDCTALEIACDASAPDEVISYLAQTTHQLGLPISNWPGESLMEMNQNINVVKTVSDKSEWTWCEHMFHPQKEGSYHK